MIDWINENNGFLMVIITLVYVIATVFICVFNGRSAKASREQIAASQKQQEQNAELQLYSMRREVINKIGKYQFADVLWDTLLLFDRKTFDKLTEVGQEYEQLKVLKIEINSFEKELKILLSDTKQAIILSQITVAKTNKVYDGLESSIRSILEGARNSDLALDSINHYIVNLKHADKMKQSVDDKMFQLVLELNEFTRKSIQMKGAKTQ